MQPKIYILTFVIFALTGCTTNRQGSPLVVQNKFTLEELEHRTFNWFWELVDKNYQVPDRHPTRQFSSIAATGFGLTTYCIGVERHYVTRNQAAERVLKTLPIVVRQHQQQPHLPWQQQQSQAKT